MNRNWLPLKCLTAGLFVTLVQVVSAVWIGPEGSFSYRYSSLIQHDGYWFANIVERGYGTTVPPFSSHKMMEVSNVAFFPAYPAIAGILHDVLRLSTTNALLLTAQLAAWGFWTYFFLFCARWKLRGLLQGFGALAILAHPAAFFLVTGYSESLFLMMLAGFIYWSAGEGRTAKVLAALHGFTMSATRIVGIPCAAFPVVHSIFKAQGSRPRSFRSRLRQYGPAVAIMLFSLLGAISFFAYCQLRWGRWDLYMLTQKAGWAISPDYLAVFKPSSYRWLIPPLNHPQEVSQLTMTLAAVLFAIILIGELVPAFRRGTSWTNRVGIYFCAAIIYYVSVAGVASVEMESMLRYDFCVHALIVLALLHYLNEFRLQPRSVRIFGMGIAAAVMIGGFAVQGFYIWNFMRGNWVA
jgi:hypothetical protein